MNAYELDIRAMKNPGMADIISTARKHISSLYLKICPWKHSELNHGKGILVSDDALNCYLVAYGLMHTVKVRRLLQGCALEDLKPGYDVVDWGCGQGLASLCLVEYLMEIDAPLPSRITLVDASPAALRRAELHLDAMTGGAVELRRVETRLSAQAIDSAWEGGVFSVGRPRVLHLLSNIFDVQGIELGALAHSITRMGSENLVLCAAHYDMEIRLKLFQRNFHLDSQEMLFLEAKHRLDVLPNGHPFGAALLAFRTMEQGCEQSEADSTAASLALVA